MKDFERNEKNVQRCNICGRIVGCDYHGRKHKCNCGNYGKRVYDLIVESEVMG